MENSNKLELQINLKYPEKNLLRFTTEGDKMFSVDPRTYILDNDIILKKIIKENNLEVKLNPDETVKRCMDWVANNIKYTNDMFLGEHSDIWTLPSITTQKGTADCEDFTLLTMSLCINAGVPYYRLKIMIGAATEQSKIGHAWMLYLADHGQWEFWETTTKKNQNKGIAKDLVGPKGKLYKKIYFTINKKYCFNQIEIKEDDKY